jgi:hypothetical protein
VAQQAYAEAEPLLREAHDGLQKATPNSYRRYEAESLLGVTLVHLGRYAEAEPLLIAGYEGMLQRQASIPFDRRSVLREAAAWTGELYEAWGKADQAEAWRAKAAAR